MKIYIIRHGETNYNVEHRFQGMWGESRLTENGKAQAKAARTLLCDIVFDRIYSSAAIRTRETSAILFPESENIAFSDDLREVDVGALTDQLRDEYRAKYPEKFKIIDETHGYEVFDGESSAAIAARAKTVMKRVMENGGDNVAIVSHGGLIRYLMGVALDLPYSMFSLCENCGISLVEIDEGKKAKICFYNRIATDAKAASCAL